MGRWARRAGLDRAYMVAWLAALPDCPRPPRGCQVVPWDQTRLDAYAAVHFAAYDKSLEQYTFPDALGDVGLCRRHLATITAGDAVRRFDAEASLVLVREGEPVGIVVVNQGPRASAWVDDLAVHPAHRGGGGRALLLASLWRLRESGVPTAALLVTRANTAARRLYTSCGFRAHAWLPFPET
jgi:GNAT superfamily N-acetyltransferase